MTRVYNFMRYNAVVRNKMSGKYLSFEPVYMKPLLCLCLLPALHLSYWPVLYKWREVMRGFKGHEFDLSVVTGACVEV